MADLNPSTGTERIDPKSYRTGEGVTEREDLRHGDLWSILAWEKGGDIGPIVFSRPEQTFLVPPQKCCKMDA
jgi:hypothetical protein